MANRVLAFMRRAVRWDAPEPPPVVKESPEGYALFYDDDEVYLLYAKPWPWVGCPRDERTNRPDWLIEGQVFTAARREGGNWIFRRCSR